MNNILRFAILSVVTVILFGCASGATKEGMMYSQSESHLSKFDASLNKQVGVQSVNGGKDTNPLWTSQISNEDFLAAVKDSLGSHGLLSNTGRYTLKINILDVTQPMFGVDLTVSATVNYVLFDTQENKNVLDEKIIAKYTAKFSDSPFAVKRLRLANEGAAKNNIKSLLEHLPKLEISSRQVSIGN